MKPSAATPLIADLHASALRIVVANTGAGSLAISQLLAVPGASRTLLEAITPYARTALVDFLGGEPEQFCCAATARSMAAAAFQRALFLDESEDPPTLCGLGCTASLATNRPKRGAHRIYVAVQTVDATLCWSLQLEKGRRQRCEEEALSAVLLLNALAEAAKISPRLELPLTDGEQCHVQRFTAPAAWGQLMIGELAAVREPRGCSPPAASRCIFPGAFNPFHAGHQQMADIARRLTGKETEFELSVENVDKPPLDYLEISQRAAQFQDVGVLWLTRAPTFSRKAEIFPGATFVIGADTAQRIGEVRYYQNEAHRDEALREIALAKCSFLVFGRLENNRFQTLDHLQLPPTLRAICECVPEAEFRADVSSTEVRNVKPPS